MHLYITPSLYYLFLPGVCIELNLIYDKYNSIQTSTQLMARLLYLRKGYLK